MNNTSTHQDPKGFTVHKDKSTPNKWKIAYKKPGGGRSSTSVYGTKADAEAKKAELMRAFIENDSADVTRHLRTTLTPSQLRDAETAIEELPKGIGLMEVVRAYRKTILDAKDSPAFEDVADGLLDALKAEGKGERYRASIRSTVGKFKVAIGDPAQPIGTITKSQIDNFLSTFSNNQTYNNRRRELMRVFTYALNEGHLDYLPLDKVKPRKVGERLPEIYSLKECEDILKKVKKYKDGLFVPYYALRLYGFIRREEADHLCSEANWRSAYNPDAGLITLEGHITKKSKLRHVSIRPMLAKLLKQYLPACEFVPKKPTRKDRSDLGIEKGNKLRHTGITFAVFYEDSIVEVADEAGNSESMIRRHYKSPQRITQIEAVQFFGPKPKAKKKKSKSA